MVFWACYGVGKKEALIGGGLIILTGGMVWFATKAKRRR